MQTADCCTSKEAASSQAVGAGLSTPHHVLMSDDGGGGSGVFLFDRQLQRDFVSKRYRSFQKTTSTGTSADAASKEQSHGVSGGIWLGVSEIERLLVSCCHVDPVDGVSGSGDEFTTSSDLVTCGALSKQCVLVFVSILAMHCHDLSSRALALAILERSLEQDVLEEAAAREKLAETETVFGTASPITLPDEPPSKRTRLSTQNKEAEGSEHSNTVGDNKETVPVGLTQQPNNLSSHTMIMGAGRIHEFLAAGGLRILQVWLLEASTPSSSTELDDSKQPTTTGATTRSQQQRQPSKSQEQPSSTGPILLTLLQFLASIPFDKQLVTKSKINKRIRSLSKLMDSLVVQEQTQTAVQPQAGTTVTHEAAGGLSVQQVKDALDHLKKVWEEKAKMSASNSSTNDNNSLFKNPFEDLQRRLTGHLDAFNKYNDGEGGDNDKPNWIAKLEEQQKAKEKKKPKQASSSAAAAACCGKTADLARRERENERAAMMREDLQRAQEQRRQLVLKLRELKQKSMNENSQTRHSQNKRSIRWRDNLGAASRERKRELLEEVFMIPSKEEDREAAASDEDADYTELEESSALDTTADDSNDVDTVEVVEVIELD